MLAKINPINEIDFEKFRNDIQKSKQESPVPPNFPTPFELAALSRDVYGDADRPPLPEGWVLFPDGVYDEKEPSKHNFGGACYIKYEGGEPIGTVFAFRGTIPSWESVCNDISIFRKKVPDQTEVARKFVWDTVGKLDRELSGKGGREDFVIFTGHSLGGTLADLVASRVGIESGLDTFSINSSIMTSVTFENPGSRACLENYLKKWGMPKKYLDEIVTYISTKFATFLSDPNIINTCNDQLGIVWRLIDKLYNYKPKARNPTYPLQEAYYLLNPYYLIDYSMRDQHAINNIYNHLKDNGRMEIDTNPVGRQEGFIAYLDPIKHKQYWDGYKAYLWENNDLVKKSYSNMDDFAFDFDIALDDLYTKAKAKLANVKNIRFFQEAKPVASTEPEVESLKDLSALPDIQERNKCLVM